MLSERAQKVNPSATLVITAKAKAMAKEGIDVVSFAAGQPDFLPPQNVLDAAIESIKAGNTKYTPATGIPELKQAVVEKFKRDNNLDYNPSQISINCGAKHSIYNICQAIVDKGDEVIIPVPYWVSYPEFITLAGGTSVFVETDEQFKITADAIKEKITGKTKLIILNSPSNPTGAVIEEEELKRIAELAVENNIYVISDEIYEKIIYRKKHVSIASLNDEIKALTFTVNGMSKSYAMPGWRLGYLAGPQEAVDAISRIQENSTSNPASIVQDAALEALNGPQEFLIDFVKQFKERRNYIVNALNEIKGVSCNTPDGAFYVFPKVDTADSVKLCEELLDKAHVACIPGAPFGKEGYIRLSYAASMEMIEKGLARLKEFLEK